MVRRWGGTQMNSYTDLGASWAAYEDNGRIRGTNGDVRLRRDNKSILKRSDNRQNPFTRPAFSGQGHVDSATWKRETSPREIWLGVYLGTLHSTHNQGQLELTHELRIPTQPRHCFPLRPSFLLFTYANPLSTTQARTNFDALRRFPNDAQLHSIYISIVTFIVNG